MFGGTQNRWGDYSATTADPVNDRDFWTVQACSEPPLQGWPEHGRWVTKMLQVGAPTPLSPEQTPGDVAIICCMIVEARGGSLQEPTSRPRSSGYSVSCNKVAGELEFEENQRLHS